MGQHVGAGLMVGQCWGRVDGGMLGRVDGGTMLGQG